MTNEIKEILDIIKKVSKAEVNSYNGLIETPPMKWEILLDYITNLQEEHNSWKRVATKNFNDAEDYKSRINKAIEYMKQENKELSVDSYFKFKDLCEFEDIIQILKGE